MTKNRNAKTTAADVEIDPTWPRDCEMGNGMMRMGFSHIPRAHEAAIEEDMVRAGLLPACTVGLVRGRRPAFSQG